MYVKKKCLKFGPIYINLIFESLDLQIIYFFFIKEMILILTEFIIKKKLIYYFISTEGLN